MDFNIPKFAHVPLILNVISNAFNVVSYYLSHLEENYQRDTLIPQSIITLFDFYIYIWTKVIKEKEYMPQALVNFVALLGWGPSKNDALLEPTLKDDVLSLKQMIKYVSLS